MESDHSYGPLPFPSTTTTSSTVVHPHPHPHSHRLHNAAPPSLSDLALRDESALDDRHQSLLELKHARKADRAEQKAALDELVPRADPGTRERKLEKKQLLNEKLRSFRDPSPGGAVEVADGDLLGGGDGEGGVEEYKKELQRTQQKVSERQLRREEIARARAAEREERVSKYRAREEVTMEALRELARRRFG
jgi:hypothetical protein